MQLIIKKSLFNHLQNYFLQKDTLTDKTKLEKKKLKKKRENMEFVKNTQVNPQYQLLHFFIQNQ